MNLQYLCTNCLAGTLHNGVCNSCHKSEAEHPERPSSALPARHMVGSRYYLGRVIGKGGFGITYLAWDCSENRRVVVKELYPGKSVKRNVSTGDVVPMKGLEAYFYKLRQRFKEEAQILYSFRHDPSVLNVYQLIEENNTVYYSMEYLSGFDLRTYIEQQGALTWEQLSVYIWKVLSTLQNLHARGLIHRDISPDNIFLTGVEEAKLIDFGSVRCYEADRKLTMILKHVYAPCEQYTSTIPQGPWTDIYALSVTMYYALSEKLPPRAPDRMQNDAAIPIAQLCPDLPSYVADAITKGMAVLRADRYSCVADMKADLFPGKKADVSEDPRRLPTKQPTSGKWRILRGVNGQYKGKQFFIGFGSGVDVGRDRRCEINYPPGTPGISRKHCRLWCDQSGNLFIQDEKSTYGTVVQDYRIEPEKWYKLETGNVIKLGNEIYIVE